MRWGRSEYYRAFEYRLEYEMGIVTGVQTAFYVNISSTQSSGMPNAQSEASFSNEWKLNLTDPAADPLGLALYGEYEIGADQIAFEPKIILDKVFGESLVAVNLTSEIESERVTDEQGASSTNHETTFEISAAYSQRIGRTLFLGMEVLARSPLNNGAFGYVALYAGPTLSLSGDRYWINFSITPQLPALKGATSGNLVLDDEQRAVARILVSYAF